MTAETLLADLGRRGIRLTPDGFDLIVEPASKLTSQDRELIREHKPAILATLAVRGSRKATAMAREFRSHSGRHRSTAALAH
jgi:hypothetical protein